MVQVAISSTMLFGLAALVVDIGQLYTTRTELQVSADAAALAAVAMLSGHDGDPRETAISAANTYARMNSPKGHHVRVEASDIEFGAAEFNTTSGKYAFIPGGENFDALRVTVHRTDAGNVYVPYKFARVIGRCGKVLTARAAAVLIPRDIAVVVDLSGSMNDDSELRHYKGYWGEIGEWRPGIQVNLRDCWCALDGWEPARPYRPGAEEETEYASDTGPVFGEMNTWGTPVAPETYDPVTDPGLWYIKKGVNTNIPAANARLLARGYSADEITCLTSGAKDSTGSQWKYRTSVILGLSEWKSGRPGGKPGGDGDNLVESGELTWLPYPSWRVSWTWSNFIDYVGSSSEMTSTNSALKYRFGLKTFTNFLLENQPRYNQTKILWQTPEQPLRAVKDAVNALTDVLIDLESMDHLSLEIYAQTPRHEVDLTDNVEAIPTRLYRMQAGHYDTVTNIGGGIQAAINELSSPRARPAAAKVILLMSDGKPNVDENGTYVGEDDPGVLAYVRQKAEDAADQHMRIYTISVGGDADKDLMSEIASIGRGQWFHAEGTPEQYQQQLDDIFRKLGGKRPVALIE